MTTHGARQAVLCTAELLEHILLGLDFFDVRRCQGVCKQFRTVIHESGRLQETMMLRLGSQPRQTWEHYFKPVSEDIRWKPQFRLVTADDTFHPLTGHRVRFTRLTPARLCPLLEISRRGSSELPPSALRLQYRSEEAVVFRTSPDLADTSWKELFVTDPPCTLANLSIEFRIGSPDFFEGGSIRVVRTVEAKDGLKLKHLVESPLEIPGEVVWSLKWQRGAKYYKYPARLLRKFENRLKAKAVISCLRTIVSLEGMVIPTKEEWRSIS